MATDPLIARDAVIRQAAFDHVRAMQSRALVLTPDNIARGFMFEGRRWPLWNPQGGIFKPREMPFLLSIRTVIPRKGGRVWYDDQRRVHQQIFTGRRAADHRCSRIELSRRASPKRAILDDRLTDCCEAPGVRPDDDLTRQRHLDRGWKFTPAEFHRR